MSSMNHGYWRSLQQLERDEVADVGPGQDGDPHEFPATAQEGPLDPMTRRNLFKLMGAGMALAGVAGAGCRRYDREEIVPLARRPEDQTPGVAQRYATAWDFVGVGQSLIATSYEGRPIKLDGNEEHPFASGAVVEGTDKHGGSSAFIQASILHLYDPDRSREVRTGGKGATFDDFRNWIAQEAPNMKASGARVRVLSEASSSPTLKRLRNDLMRAMPGLAWYEWEPLSFDNERAGTRMAFGHPVRPLAKLENAKRIVTLDADLFVEHPASLQYAGAWSRARRWGSSTLGAGEMNRLYAVESAFSTSGAVADHRLPVRSELILPFAMALDAALASGGDPTHPMFGTKDAPTKARTFLEALIADLNKNRGSSVVVAGRKQPAAVHALVARINQSLNAVGSTLEYRPDPDPDRLDHGDAIVKLAGEIKNGQVDYLFILGGNPVYDAPGDLGFADLLAQVKKGSVHLGEYEDETSQKTTWHVPRAHFLEAWGDCLTWDGTYTVAQPLIEPMYGGISSIEMVTLLLGKDGTANNARDSVALTFGTSAKVSFRRAIHDGFVQDSAAPAESNLVVGQLPMADMSGTRGSLDLPRGTVEVTFVHSTQTWDGRFGNNAWMWELPDFLTKANWDNYAMVSPSTSKDLGLDNDSIIEITVGGKKLRIACYTMPGQAPNSIAVVLGGGRTAAGRVGGQPGADIRGFDPNPIRMSTSLDIASGATVAATGDSYPIASTQEHWDISAGGYSIKDLAQKGIKERIDALVREATVEDAKKSTWPESEWAADDNHFPTESLWKEHEYPEGRVHRWGMSIDLSSCTGCNACVVACVAENNIPVVGKDNVFMQREMHWLRIDRYFKGSPDDPEIVHQPLACVQCENAPCEQVCPVGATIHSSEGLNDMVYNRCIGTRYCLNNCPYKVRRFNFFDYNTEWREARNKVRRLLFNPDVTVRMRGVMEKCTYCVQRIQNAKIAAKNARTALADGDIKTACQMACPTEAIVFGDLNDEKSRVKRLHDEDLTDATTGKQRPNPGGDKRHYQLLSAELNTKPRTHHLARIKNPNKDLER